MFEAYTSNAIMAKARSMYGHRISAEQYDSMIKCHSVSQVAGFLKNQTHYADALSNISENDIHRGQLENLLHRAIFESYSRLYRYLTRPGQSLFDYVVIEAEIREILRMVLLLKADNAKSFILDLPGYLIHRSRVDLLAVARATSYSELIMAVGSGDYADILRRFEPTSEKPLINYVGCEHAFYEYFYRRVFQMIQQQYTGDERKELQELIRLRIELLNLNRIFRCKTYLETPKEDIIHSIYPYYYKISSRQLNDLIQSDSPESLSNLFVKTPYSRMFEDVEYPYIEDYTNRIQYRKCQHALHLSNHPSVAFYAYVTISQIELSNIINIIEGIRYQIPENEIKNLIILS